MLELDGARAALTDLGRERKTLTADVILWQGRAVAAKVEQDLLLLGGTGGRAASCPRPNQRSMSSSHQKPNAAWDVDHGNEYGEEGAS